MRHKELENLHRWIKDQSREHTAESMSTDPNKHDPLEYPGVKSEHPKTYMRRLWLVADNDRMLNPKFRIIDAIELCKHTNNVRNAEKLHEELSCNALLEAYAEHT